MILTKRLAITFAALAAGTVFSVRAYALEPAQVAVVYCADDADSTRLAQHYAQKRGIPKGQLLGLKLPGSENISRVDYEEQLAGAIRKWLQDKGLKDKIRCLALIRPIPLRVLGSEPDKETKNYVLRMRSRFSLYRKTLNQADWGFTQLAAGKPIDNPPDVTDKISGKSLRSKLLPSSAKAAKKVAAMAAGPAREKAAADLYRLWQIAFGREGVIQLAEGKDKPAPPASVDLAGVRKQLAQDQAAIQELSGDGLTADQQVKRAELIQDTRGMLSMLMMIENDFDKSQTPGEIAAVDSELSLLWQGDYRLSGSQANNLQWRRGQGPSPAPTLMVSRIDGPDFKLLLKMVDTCVEVEQKGLTGRAYIDLQVSKPGAYSLYDRDLEKLGALIQNKTDIPVTIEKTAALFKPGSAKDCALYCGWYSLRHYIPAFEFKPGAVAWHIASLEAQYLRDEKPRRGTWCQGLLRDGVATTFGALEEPYLHAFPKPSEFFGLLLTGRYTMAEVFYLTKPLNSWMMTFIGDPLYTPFKANPKLKLEELTWFKEPAWLKQ